MKRVWLVGLLLVAVAGYAAQYRMVVTNKVSSLQYAVGVESTFTRDTFEITEVRGYKNIFGSVVVNQGASEGGDTTNFGTADSVQLVLYTQIGELTRIISTANSRQIPGTLLVRGDTLYEKLFLVVNIFDSLGMSDTSTTAAKFRVDIKLKVID